MARGKGIGKVRWSMAACCALCVSLGEGRAQVQPLENTQVPPGNVTALSRGTETGEVVPLDVPAPEIKTVFAVGRAAIVNGNVESARRVALQSAYAEAVAIGVGTEIGRLTMIRNVRAVSDIVASRSRGFVRGYTVVSEGLVDGAETSYEVRINAEVVERGSEEPADVDGLRLFLEVLGNPRLLIILPADDASASAEGLVADEETHVEVEVPEARVRIERRAERASPDAVVSNRRPASGSGRIGRVEAAFAQAFGRFGYQVVTTDDLMARGIEERKVQVARDGATVEAIELARACGADLLLVGGIAVSLELVKPAGVSYVSATAEVSAKVIVTSTGRIVEAFHRDLSKAHPNRLAALARALDALADVSAETLAWKIPAILAAYPRVTSVVLEGVDFNEAEAVRMGLGAVPGIEAVRYIRMPTTERAWTKMEVLSGFLLVEQEELVTRVQESLKRGVDLVEADRFSLRLRVR